MAHDVVRTLFTGIDDAWRRLEDRIAGLTESEYLWEPVPDVWTVRPDGGRWIADRRREPEPDPQPVTTIAWRMWHIASDDFASYISPALGDWPLPLPGDEWYGEVAPAVAAMELARDAFRERVTALGEDGIWSKLGPAWGPFADDTWAALVVHAQDELSHHGAEIGLLRDLYARLG